MRVLAIAGSLRPGSYNRMLLTAAGQLVPEGVQLTVWEGLAQLPAYSEALDGPLAPVEVRAWRQVIADSDALLIATPEYNASLPGALKNALDWASRPYPDNALKRMPASVIGASTGLFGAVWAQAEVRKVLKTSGADVLDHELAVGQAADAFDNHGELIDAAVLVALQEMLDALVDRARGRTQCAA